MMGKNNGFKRVLSVVLSLVLLLSSMAVAGVSAAGGAEFHYTFDDSVDSYTASGGYAGYYSTGGHNVKYKPGIGIETERKSGGYSTSGYAMRMAYTANGTTADAMAHASFSVPNNTGAAGYGSGLGKTLKLPTGSAYQITVTYKVTGYKSAASLYFAIGLGALGIDNNPAWSSRQSVKFDRDITATTNDWVTASAVITPTTQDGAYIVLKMADDTNRTGTEVLIGKIDIVPASAATITFDSNGGSTVSSVSGMSGAAVTYPAAPTKRGYSFVGWFDQQGNAAPATFPTSNLTLVARWRDDAAWGFESETVGDDLSINSYAAIVTDTEHFGGSHALRLRSTKKTAADRPQLLVKDASGNRVAVEAGKDYSVSFWLKVPADAAYTEINYWLTATDDDDAYTSSTQKDAEKIYERSGASMSKGVWQEFTAVIENCAYSGNVRLGIAVNSADERIFYLDDLLIEEIIPYVPQDDVWSFESESADQELSINNDTNYLATVTDADSYSGNHALFIKSSNKTAVARPQVLVKDESGNRVTVEAGKDYEISFWVKVPEGAPFTSVNYWLTATDDDNVYTQGQQKTDELILELNDQRVAAKGVWEKFTATIENCALGGNVRLGITTNQGGGLYFYVDDFCIKELQTVPPMEGAWSFESETKGSLLDLNTTGTETITVVDDVKHTGKRAVRVNASNSSGNARPQMMVKDAAGELIEVDAGKDYRITFWAMVPVDGHNNDYSVWFTAVPEDKKDTAHSSSFNKSDLLIGTELTQPQSVVKGEWQQITYEIDNSAFGGYLRLGIAASGANTNAVVFYLDDIKVETVNIETVPPMDGAWSFENEAKGETLDLNTTISEIITVTDEAKHTGKKAVRVNTSNITGDKRAQMMVKNTAGEFAKVEAGKSYRFTFWAMVPVGGHDNDYNVWFTAIPDGKESVMHSGEFAKNTYIVGNELTQPQTVEKGEWQQITYEVEDCTLSGALRLGIAAQGANGIPVTIYIDDIKVEEIQVDYTEPEEGAWSFEDETKDDTINVSGAGTITVTNEAKHTGKQSARVNGSSSSGNGRPQMMVKGADGAFVQVEAEKNYRITFWAMVPTSGLDKDYSVWFTAVTEDKKDTCHSGDYNKSDYLVGNEITVPQSVEKGEWQQLTYDIEECSYSGLLRLGIAAHGANNSAFVFYLDDIKIEEIEVDVIPPEEGAWSFETEAKGEVLSVNTSTSEKITVTNEAKHSGKKAVRIDCANSTGNGRAQMMVKNAAGEFFKVEAEKNYRVTFWVMVPESGGHDYPYNVWFTAVPEDKVGTAHDGAFDKNSYIIGNEITVDQSVAKGEWQQLTYDIEDCAYNGYLRIGLAGNGAGRNAIKYYLDDIKISPLQVDYTAPEEGAWSFETESNGMALDLNATGSEMITVTTEAKHTGKKAARINAANSSGNDRPQMLVKNDKNEYIQLEAGKGYRISFWVMMPEGGLDKDYSIWFTAVGEDKKDTCHGADFNKNDYLIDSELTIPQSVAKGEWQLITRDVDESAYSGYLRIGLAISGAGRTAVKFYIDDIKVTPIVHGDYEPQSFENYEIGTELDMNTDPNRSVIVTDKYACTGDKSAQVNSNNSGGDDRPQMLVKDGNGRQYKVKKGRNYEVTFSIFIPETEVNYSVNYWLAATTDEVCFSKGGQRKNDYVIAEKSSTDQLTKGVWNSVTIAITDCKFSGKLRLGITGSISRKPNDPHTFYIDDLNVVETIIDGDRYTMSFEPYELGTKLSMNKNGASITVSDIERRAGYQSAQFITVGSDLNEAPQMTVNTFQIEPVKVEKGKRYRVSFWMLVPVGEPDYDIQFWLAATNNAKAFTASAKRTNLVVDTQTIKIDEKGVWKQVLLTIDKCAYTGMLRLGATGTTNVPHTFYLDDIKVEERNSTPVDLEAMNFENLTVGENISIANDQNLTAVVTDMDSYTGNQSVYISSNANTGDARPQFNAVDGKGKLMKMEKGRDYFITFSVMVPTTESYFTFSYWAAVVPEDKLDEPFKRNSDFIKNDYVIAEISGADQPLAGEWHEIKLAVTNCKYDGYLRMGFTHHNAPPFTSHFYIDDIKLSDPDYVTVKFETNGADNAEDYQPITIMSETLIPTQEYVDPYRFGYEFMGWYSSKDFNSDSYVDLYSTPIVGKNGEVITLYALWEKWTEVQAGEREESKDKFKVEYYTEKVWIGDQNVADPLTAGDAPNVNDAAPIVVTPDEEKPNPEPQTQPQGSMPPWIIVVIIIAAVVVTGGGATIAAIMLKKNKKA